MTSEKKLLGGVRLFADLNNEALSELAMAGRRAEKERDVTLFRQGEDARRFFVILRGRVKVTQITPEGHQVLVRYAGAGDLFGCVSLYGGFEYPATATTVTRCEVISWDRATTDRFMERYPRIALNALEVLGKELADLRTRYQDLATRRVEQRVARALVRIARDAGKKVDAGVLIEFPLSRQDLAELTGTTLHTVSRILSDWKAQGMIDSGRRRIVIRNPHKLVSVAEDLNS